MGIWDARRDWRLYVYLCYGHSWLSSLAVPLGGSLRASSWVYLPDGRDLCSIVASGIVDASVQMGAMFLRLLTYARDSSTLLAGIRQGNAMHQIHGPIGQDLTDSRDVG